MELLARIASLIEPTVADMGLSLVRVRLLSGQPPTLQIMAERLDGTMNIDDCTELSRALSALLDVEDPIDGEYNLEVSSPGIDRPLVRLSDFVRFQGLEAKIETDGRDNGRKRFRGRLMGVEERTVLLEGEDGPHRLAYDAITGAKLVLNDELINEPPRPVVAAAGQEEQGA
jgi:ribosome maturation factor RimP